MMARRKFSAREEARIKAMADELQEKMEYAFARPPDDLRIAEIKALRKSLEELGFMVTWEAVLNAATYAVEVTVTLWLPKASAGKPN